MQFSTPLILLLSAVSALVLVAAYFVARGPSIVGRLIIKYLRKRRIAWVALVAVTLCTAMVLVVISVMGGWLRMFEQSFRGVQGDVVIRGESDTGFEHYEAMVKAVEKLDCVHAAAPVVRCYGLITIGEDSNAMRQPVQVIGFPQDIGRVNSFSKSLFLWNNPEHMPTYTAYVKPREGENEMRVVEIGPKGKKQTYFEKPLPDDAYRAMRRWPADEDDERSDPASWPGIVIGADMVGADRTNPNEARPNMVYEVPVTLTILTVEPGKRLDNTSVPTIPYWIVDDSRTDASQYDASFVYVPFEKLQQDLKMHGRKTGVVDAKTGRTIEILPRANDIYIRLKPEWGDGEKLVQARDQIDAAVKEVLEDNKATVDKQLFRGVKVLTWRDINSTLLGAVQKEKLLTVLLFAIISIVAIFLIFCIFYMIVAEKTRDIGIIKSVGASAYGVAGIFLGYGTAIGVVGAGLGYLASYLLVRYINEIHTWLGERLGVQVWDKQVYLFDKIPNEMDPFEVTIILSIAILSSVFGALVPAIRAARMNPVEALRWE